MIILSPSSSSIVFFDYNSFILYFMMKENIEETVKRSRCLNTECEQTTLQHGTSTRTNKSDRSANFAIKLRISDERASSIKVLNIKRRLVEDREPTVCPQDPYLLVFLTLILLLYKIPVLPTFMKLTKFTAFQNTNFTLTLTFSSILN